MRRIFEIDLSGTHYHVDVRSHQAFNLAHTPPRTYTHLTPMRRTLAILYQMLLNNLPKACKKKKLE